MVIPGEGYWKSANGAVYHHSLERDGTFAFEWWSEGKRCWHSSYTPGPGPWTPCEDPSVDNARRDQLPETRPHDATSIT